MFFVFIARALMGMVMAMERPVELVHASLDMWAGEVRGEQREIVTIKIHVSKKELVRIAQNPDVVLAYRQAQLLEAAELALRKEKRAA